MEVVKRIFSRKVMRLHSIKEARREVEEPELEDDGKRLMPRGRSSFPVKNRREDRFLELEVGLWMLTMGCIEEDVSAKRSWSTSLDLKTTSKSEFGFEKPFVMSGGKITVPSKGVVTSDSTDLRSSSNSVL